MAEKFELRSIFNPDVVTYIASQIQSVYPEFRKAIFIQSTLMEFDHLGYNERIERICDQLEIHLPKEFLHAVDILDASLGEEIEDEELKGFEGFYVMPLSLYVARHGLTHFERSMLSLKTMTKRFSSEFAIRDFFIQEPEKTHAALKTFAHDSNVHVRRLVSEGSRPRLPMAKRLHQYIAEPSPVFELLEALKNEPTRLVQRSIANNLNDIAKDHPQAVITFLERWKTEKVRDIEWIISHAIRSLIKSGFPPALKLLGFDPELTCKSTLSLDNDAITLGEALNFTCKLISSIDARAIIDYRIHFKKANRELKPKVFKLKTVSLKANEPLIITKRHKIQKTTTRQYYKGIQKIELQINGQPTGELLGFELYM